MKNVNQSVSYVLSFTPFLSWKYTYPLSNTFFRIPKNIEFSIYKRFFQHIPTWAIQFTAAMSALLDKTGVSQTDSNTCYMLQIIGVYCWLLMVLSVMSNFLFIYIFVRHKDLQTPLNMLVISLVVLNLFGSILELPFIAISNMKCK